MDDYAIGIADNPEPNNPNPAPFAPMVQVAAAAAAEQPEDDDDEGNPENPLEGDAMMIADEPVQLAAADHVHIPAAVMNPFALAPHQIPAPLPQQNPMVMVPNPMEARNGEHHEPFRSHKLIPIYIVEDHNQVIPFIHENIRKKYFPIEGNTLIHFDSHPDMLIPRDMPADEAYEPSKLYMWHAVENWIMPNCYTGIFQNLVWVRPPWSNQIRNESQKISIGKCKQSGKMRLDCRENYFVSEGLFKLRHELEDVREINLDILTLGNRVNDLGDDIGRMMYISENNDKTPTVLDIDLDFFTTNNPFIGLYGSAGLYPRLRHLFHYTPPQSNDDADVVAAQAARTEQLDELQELFYYLRDNRMMPDFEGDQPSQRYLEVLAIFNAVTTHYNLDDVDWDTIYSAGCTIDETELPHHLSTPEELEIMYQCFRTFLDTFLDPPRIITISRSSDDDYCPRLQVNEIQTRVLEILNQKFMCAPPVCQYLQQQAEAAQQQAHQQQLLQQQQQQQQQQHGVSDVDDESMDPDPDSVSSLSSGGTSSRSSNNQMSDSSSSRSNPGSVPPPPEIPEEAGPSDQL